MTSDVKAVFVRLPLSASDRRLVRLSYSGSMNSDEAFDKALIAIGIPVASGELEVVGYVSENSICLMTEQDACSIHLLREHERSFDTGLVRQSDHLAALAQRDAEIARLREALRWITYTAHDLPEFMRVEIMLEWAEKALKGPEA